MNKKAISSLCQNVPEILDDLEKWTTQKEYQQGANAVAEAINGDEGLTAEIFENDKCTHFALLALQKDDITLEQFTSISLYWSGQEDYKGKYYDIDHYTLPTTNKKTTNASYKFRQFVPLLSMMGLFEIPLSDEDFDAVIEALADESIPESERRFSVLYFDNPQKIADILHIISGLGFDFFMPRKTKNGYELIIPSFSMVQTVLNVLKPGKINLAPKIGELSAEDVFKLHVESSHPFGISILGYENLEADNQKSLRLGFALHDIYHAVLLAFVPVKEAIHHITKLGQQFAEDQKLNEESVMTQSLGFLIDQEFQQYLRIAILKKVGFDVSLTQFKKYINPETCFIQCLSRLLFPKINPKDISSFSADNIKPLQDDFFAFILADIVNNHEKWNTEYGINSRKLANELLSEKNPLDLFKEMVPGLTDIMQEFSGAGDIISLQNSIYEHLQNTTQALMHAANDKDHKYYAFLNEDGINWCKKFDVDNNNNDEEEEIKDDKLTRDNYDAFVDAVISGDLDKVNKFLEDESFDINVVCASKELFPDVLIGKLLDEIKPELWEDKEFVACFKAIVETGLNFNLYNQYASLFKFSVKPVWSFLQNKDIGMPVNIRQFCIENGAPINSLSEDKEEAEIHFALRNSNVGYLEFLCEHGADVNVRNSDGETVRDLSTYIGLENYEAIEKLLEEFGADASEPKKKRPEKQIKQEKQITPYKQSAVYDSFGFLAEDKRKVKKPLRQIQREEKQKRLVLGQDVKALLDEYIEVVESTNGLEKLIDEVVKLFAMEPADLLEKINCLDLETKSELIALPMFFQFLSTLGFKDEEKMIEFVKAEKKKLRKEQKEMLSDEKTQSALAKLDPHFDSRSVQMCFVSLLEKMEELQDELEECEDKKALVDSKVSEGLQKIPELYQTFFASLSSSLQTNDDIKKITEISMKFMMMFMQDDLDIDIDIDIDSSEYLKEKAAHLMLISAKNITFKMFKLAKQGTFSLKRIFVFYLQLGIIEEDMKENMGNRLDDMASKLETFILDMYEKMFEGSIQVIYELAGDKFFSTFLEHYHSEEDQEFLEASIQVLLDGINDDEVAERAQDYINNDGDHARLLNQL